MLNATRCRRAWWPRPANDRGRVRTHVGQVASPIWQDTAGLQGHLLGQPAACTADTRRTGALYAALVKESQAQDTTFWRDSLQSQVYLGDENFVQRMQTQLHAQLQHDKQIPKAQRWSPQSWLAQCQGDRDQALYLAYRQGGMTMTQLGRESGLLVSHVSRLIATGSVALAERLARIAQACDIELPAQATG